MGDAAADTAAAPAPAPRTTARPWTCNNLNIEDPVTVKFWPIFHASRAGAFGTAIGMLIMSMLLIILLVISQVLIRNQGYRRNSTIAVVVIATIGILLCAGFSALGMQYTKPEWDAEDNKDKPGIFDNPKHDKIMVDGKEQDQCDGFLQKPWVWIVLIPGVIVFIGIIVMVIAARKKKADATTTEDVAPAA